MTAPREGPVGPFYEQRTCATCGRDVAHTIASGLPVPHNAAKRTPCPSTVVTDAKPTAVLARDADGRRLPMPLAIERWVRRRDRDRCVRCDRGSAGELHLHHILEVCEGGAHDPDNLDTLCAGCHDRVTAGLLGDMTYAEWKAAPSGDTFELMVAQSRRDDEQGRTLRAQFATMTAAGLIDLMARMQAAWKDRP